MLQFLKFTVRHVDLPEIEILTTHPIRYRVNRLFGP